MEEYKALEKNIKITTWLPPEMVTLRPQEKMRITFVDGAFQLYGHQKEARHIIRKMRAYFRTRYDLEDHPEDKKTDWKIGDVCVSKIDNNWYRAKVIEMSNTKRYAAVIYVDLGNIRVVDILDLRIPTAFANQPSLAIRMVLESVIPPKGNKVFPHPTLEAIQEEIVYWNTGYVKVTSTRKVKTFPIPIKLYLVNKNGEREEYEDFGQTLLNCELADTGDVDILSPHYTLYARTGN